MLSVSNTLSSFPSHLVQTGFLNSCFWGGKMFGAWPLPFSLRGSKDIFCFLRASKCCHFAGDMEICSVHQTNFFKLQSRSYSGQNICKPSDPQLSRAANTITSFYVVIVSLLSQMAPPVNGTHHSCQNNPWSLLWAMLFNEILGSKCLAIAEGGNLQWTFIIEIALIPAFWFHPMRIHTAVWWPTGKGNFLTGITGLSWPLPSAAH